MKTAASYIKKKYDCYKDYSEQSIRDVCHIWCEVIEEAQNDVKKEYEERLRFIPVEEELPPKLRIASVMVRFFSNLFTSKCPKCKTGRVRYVGDDWTGNTWISVYECKNCKTEFI